LKDYGGVVFFNISKAKQSMICEWLTDKFGLELGSYHEEMNVVLGNNINEQGFDEFIVDYTDIDTINIICIYMAQSVALFHYQKLSDELLENTRKYTTELELKGKVSLSRKSLIRYIGSTLKIKNKISENLYIFDSPMMAWQDERMNRINTRLNENLEIKYRYNAIQEQLNVIQENLELFKDLNLHNHSSFLEWIIIILILVEVIHVFL
jgi:uncharacterized Rmd1/YagE family protein